MAEKIIKPFQTEINSFRTLNPNDHPRNISDDEMAICLGFMPVGKALKTVPSNVKTLDASTDASLDIEAMFEANLAGTRYRFVALSDGSLIRYDTAWSNRTVVAAAGTFTRPSFAQWKNTHMLILDPVTGYFSYGDSGIILGINATPDTAGSGYAVNDTLIVTTGDSNAVVTVQSVDGSGGVTALVLTSGGTGYELGAGQATSSGGTGCTVEISSADETTGAILSYVVIPTAGGTGYAVNDILTITTGDGNATVRVVSVAAGVVTEIVLVNAGTGYVAGAGQATSSGGTGCTVNVTNMDSSLSARISTYVGTSIAVFEQRAFLANGLVITFSEANDFDGFGTGSGSVQDNLPSIGLAITKLISLGDYLYVIGQRGTHIINSTQVLDDASYIFTISDALPNIGTNYPNTILVHENSIYLFSVKGLVAISGTTFEIFSDGIAYLLSLITNLSSASCFLVSLFGKTVFCFTATLTSPISAQAEQWFLCLVDGKWFCAKAGAGSLYSVALTVQNSTFASYETFLGKYNIGSGNGNEITEAFGGTASTLKKVRTKAFSFGATAKDKTITRAGAVVTAGGLTPTLRVISDITGTATLLAPDAVPDSGDYLYTREIDARGKALAIDYEETSATQYTLSGFVIEGVVGADW